MIGQIDNSKQKFSPAQTGPVKVPFHTRLRGRLRARRPLLYKNAGLHLRLPKPYDHIVYVYIGKNGCSAFKRWFLHDMGERRGHDANISIVAERYAFSVEWELARTRRLLILRDPVERMCSLYRNKFRNP
ncbi:sulfotransferase family 2 domain-containing protein [Rhodovulum marinum]|uniref:sulfotransferase family 2 domain-containing protein n=1 Tax=Rhodovulum marinum TaxID=320662 RepID=UPI001044B019